MILHLSKQIEATRVKRIERALGLSLTLAFLSEMVGLNAISKIFLITIMLLLWTGLYALTFRALKKMLYSFLTLMLFTLILHLILALVHFMAGQVPHAIISGINVLVCVWIVYAVNRPIFYPKINWTEYDFRHRKDRRILVELNADKRESARLYDTRRGEAALQSFVELELDKDYDIFNQDGDFIGKAKILSQRKTLLGRPITHGIRLREQR